MKTFYYLKKKIVIIYFNVSESQCQLFLLMGVTTYSVQAWALVTISFPVLDLTYEVMTTVFFYY